MTWSRAIAELNLNLHFAKSKPAFSNNIKLCVSKATVDSTDDARKLCPRSYGARVQSMR